MDYKKILLSILLVLAFYILFGQESIEKLKKGGISISRTEEEPQNLKEPGKCYILKFTLKAARHFNLCLEIE